MDIKKKNLSFTRAKHNLGRMPPFFYWYYKRYLHLINMEPVEMDKVESFFVMKKWCKGKILDLGCGLGYLTHYFRGCGVDKNKEIISIAKDLYPHLNFDVWNNSSAITQESFNTIICYNLIEHISENERVDLFKKINRMLEKDGRVVFGYANPYNLLQFFKGFFSKSALFDPTHIYNWSIKQFKQIVAEAFEIIEIKKASPFTKCIRFSKYFKGDILILCSAKKQKTIPTNNL